mmetsp:Transcript_20780/g.39027  ORF Transcript_20780/g.39027 Transcript_20780/m.39027 type:complete len:237 (+) Transcript_20780:26-736(+)
MGRCWLILWYACARWTSGNESEVTDPTDSSAVLEQLTVAMVAKVIDGQTVDIRSSGKTLLRLGNTALPESEDAAIAAKAALEAKVSKQMIWWKEAPSDAQRTTEERLVVDIWSLEGEHIPSYMVQNGHLHRAEEYSSELAQDILSVAAAKQKQEHYQALEEALRETQDLVKESQSQAMEKKDEHAYIAHSNRGFMVLGMLMILLVAAMFVGLTWTLQSMSAPQAPKVPKSKKAKTT